MTPALGAVSKVKLRLDESENAVATDVPVLVVSVRVSWSDPQFASSKVISDALTSKM